MVQRLCQELHSALELRHYNVQLVLQPLDVVVFLSNSVYHCTLQHAAHVIDPKSQVGDCMAITCFFHQALVDHYEPTKTSIHYLAKEAAAREQDRKRQKKGSPLGGVGYGPPQISMTPSFRQLPSLVIKIW